MKNAVSILSAIAHEGRLGLFRQLVKAGADGLAVGELAQLARANITTVSAQLSVLDHAGLVDRRRDGRSIIYTANGCILQASTYIWSSSGCSIITSNTMKGYR